MSLPIQHTLLQDILITHKNHYSPTDTHKHWALIDPVTLLNYLPHWQHPTYSFQSHPLQHWTCVARVFDKDFGRPEMWFKSKKMAKRYTAGLVIECILGWKRDYQVEIFRNGDGDGEGELVTKIDGLSINCFEELNVGSSGSNEEEENGLDGTEEQLVKFSLGGNDRDEIVIPSSSSSESSYSSSSDSQRRGEEMLGSWEQSLLLDAFTAMKIGNGAED